jgi:hypothetical protein
MRRTQVTVEEREVRIEGSKANSGTGRSDGVASNPPQFFLVREWYAGEDETENRICKGGELELSI